MDAPSWVRPIRLGLALLAATVLPLLVAPAAAGGDTPADDTPPNRLVVYLIDHQYVSNDELVTIQSEIESIFEGQAGVEVEWILDASPRRKLRSEELRVILLASDGTRWFHGPSNIIGLAPHDDTGIGRNCFVFYRQALWFRQQAVLRCREATRARTQADARGEEPDPSIDDIAPPRCGQFLPSLTPLIVARAAAHEMVHILLNKLDHSERGLMRDSFDLSEWLAATEEPFRLRDDEVVALQTLLLGAPVDNVDP